MPNQLRERLNLRSRTIAYNRGRSLRLAGVRYQRKPELSKLTSPLAAQNSALLLGGRRYRGRMRRQRWLRKAIDVMSGPARRCLLAGQAKSIKILHNISVRHRPDIFALFTMLLSGYGKEG